MESTKGALSSVGNGKQEEHQSNTNNEDKSFFLEDRHKLKTQTNSALSKKLFNYKWRTKRTKTGGFALVYCLNIGIDPPDVIKTDPCARLECWLDPTTLPQQKALEMIGKALQTQYESLQSNLPGQCKLSLDPTVDEVKKTCLSLRHQIKQDRLLFHYNGHGVPKPTQNGELWVFNKNYTQYIPLSIYELQSWVGSPSLYIFDCSAAGMVIRWFLQYADQRQKDFERLSYNSNPSSVVPVSDFILLGACGSNEILPMNPNLPADMFTACITTPVKMALQWFVINSPLCKPGITLELIDKIPGKPSDRRTPIGELNWIFFAITDTIAWNVLPRDLFHRLFRQDLMVATIYRNFLLAERIMRTHGCTPISYPKLSSQTYQHPLWQAWDLAVDMCLSQLPDIIKDPTIEYKFNPFFADQLTAFEVWLDYASENKKPPEQLPILLQVLLSPLHRKKALDLLGRFVDLGHWAVNQSLSVGIFRCVLRLLTPSPEFRQILVFIWTKIMAFDKSCQVDLVKENGHTYFLSVLSNVSIETEQRVMAAFILSVVCNNCRPGQSACLNGKLLQIIVPQLGDPDPMLRRWLLLCLAKLWESFEDAKVIAIKEGVLEKMCAYLNDPVPEVRAASLYAIGTFFGGAEGNEDRVHVELNLGITLPVVTEDVSPLVRKEQLLSYFKLIRCYERQFSEISAKFPEPPQEEAGQASVFMMIWKIISGFTSDPFPEVSKLADSIVRFISDKVVKMNGQNLAPSSPKSVRSNSIKKPKGLSPGPPLANLGHRKAKSMDIRESVDPPPVLEELLSSVFYEWSCDYFSKPLLTNKTIDVFSPSSLLKQRKIMGNHNIKNDAVMLNKNYNNAMISRFDEQVAIIDNSPRSPASVLFHAFEPIIVLADDRDQISVWDREQCLSLSTFSNRSSENSQGSHATQLCFINEHDQSMLLTGADDGVVRVYGDVATKPYLVTSWNTIPRDFGPNQQSYGLTLHWDSEIGILATGGNFSGLRIWNLGTEMLQQDIPSSCEFSVTALAGGPSHSLVTGYSDGSVRLFDYRARHSLAGAFLDHSQWIVNVHVPKTSPNTLITGSVSGEVKFWDIRNVNSKPVKSFIGQKAGLMTAMAVHDYAPIIACGAEKQKINVFNFNGDELSETLYYYGFLGHRIGPVSCLAFHPYMLLLAAGAMDCIVSLYTKR